MQKTKNGLRILSTILGEGERRHPEKNSETKNGATSILARVESATSIVARVKRAISIVAQAPYKGTLMVPYIFGVLLGRVPR